MLEAWGPDLASCCEEAVAALVGTYAEPARTAASRSVLLHLPPDSAESLLVGVLDEVIFQLDTSQDVPVGAAICVAGDGGLDVTLTFVDRAAVHPTGSVPKAISRSGLVVVSRSDRVWCRFLVDI
jgi:SHS2 domain-containing protein